MKKANKFSDYTLKEVYRVQVVDAYGKFKGFIQVKHKNKTHAYKDVKKQGYIPQGEVIICQHLQ